MSNRTTTKGILCTDGLYTDDEINAFREYVMTADAKNRNFANAPFKNGKMILPEWSSLMYSRIAPHLPERYTDRQGKSWSFVEASKYVMYAQLVPGQSFPLHTDTGCEYDEESNRFSKFTVLTYLNDDYEGGHTTFFDDSFKKTTTIIPKTNCTLILDIDLFHQGERLESGVKYWIGTELVCQRIESDDSFLRRG